MAGPTFAFLKQRRWHLEADVISGLLSDPVYKPPRAVELGLRPKHFERRDTRLLYACILACSDKRELLPRVKDPRRAAEIMGRYGLATAKVNRRREYRDVKLEHLRAIERNYGFDLNTEGQMRVAVEQRLY